MITERQAEQARRWTYGLLAAAFSPPSPLDVAAWAEDHRIISADSGSPHPGKWRHARTPYLVEIMEVGSPTHPCSEYVVKKSAQTGATEAGLNVVAGVVDVAPAPMIYLLPTREMAGIFDKQKLDPLISANARLRHKIRRERESGRSNSTTTFKRFAGGYLVTANAYAASQLQMYSAKYAFCDEVSQYPGEAGSDGDPVEQIRARLTAYERVGYKLALYSTPSLVGHCRIEAAWQASDKRLFYVPCPHCGMFQPLEFKRFRWESDVEPYRPYFECAAHGCVIEHKDLDRMILALAPGEEHRGIGRLWIKTYEDEHDPTGNPAPPVAIAPEDFPRWRARRSGPRSPGFHVWQAMSRFSTWASIVRGYVNARDNTAKLKSYTQRVLGEPFAEEHATPDDEKLFLMRGDRPIGTIPPGYPVLSGAVDVQGDRLEWAVYAWGAQRRSALVDKGVIAGDTGTPEPWAKLDGVLRKLWPGPSGRKWGVEGWFIDAGHHSNVVYHFCHGRGGATGRPFVLPIMGSGESGPKARLAPLVSTARPVDYEWNGKPAPRGLERRDLGTWPLKEELYTGLRQTLRGVGEDGQPREGAIAFCRECDAEFFKQITNEALIQTEDRQGRQKPYWKKLGPNEQLDLWCYSRALVEMLRLYTELTPADWTELAAQREAPPQAEMFTGRAALDTSAAPRVSTPAPKPAASPPAPEWGGGGWD